MKLCLSFNDPSIYREAIYKLIDQEYECDWYFDEMNSQLKSFDTSCLKSVNELSRINVGPLYWVRGLCKLLWKDYDIFLMRGATRNVSLFVMLLIKKLCFPHKRIYLWTHGYYGKESKIELFFWKRPLYKLADGNFCYGNHACELMKKDGFNENKLFPIHNSLSYNEQLALRMEMYKLPIYNEHFHNDYPTIIFLGRLTSVKKLNMLVEAAYILDKKNYKVNISFVGEGPEREMLGKMVEERGLSERVWFYGESYDQKTNAKLVYNADLCVAPGNIGLTAIHAMMFGCPCISHDNFAWQMPEYEAIKPRKTGNFFKFENVESLADTIMLWLNDNKNKRDIIRKQCYFEIDNFWTPEYQMGIIRKYLK